MSQHYIDNLSTELLNRVFDYLNFKQQLTAKTVCVRWLEILTGTKYLRQQQFRLKVEAIESLSKEVLEKYRAFSVFIIGNVVSERKIRHFLLQKEVSEQLEQLELVLLRHSWTQLLAREKTIRLPKLTKLTLLCSDPAPKHGDQQIKLVLPNLRELVFKIGFDSTYTQLLQQCSDQIETLSIRFRDHVTFLTTFERYSFSNLTNLTLELVYRGKLCDRNLSSKQSAVFNRLKELTIVCLSEGHISGYEYVIRAATNLEKLITNDMFDPKAYNEIVQLKKLRELLFINFDHDLSSARKMSLPELRKLTLISNRMIPLEATPKLKKLLWTRNVTIAGAELDVFFAAFTHSLEKFKVSLLPIDEAVLEHFCSLGNLKQLELESVALEAHTLSLILRSLTQLQKFYVQKCLLVDNILDGTADADEKSCDEETCRAHLRHIFSQLARQYPRCVVLSEYCFYQRSVRQDNIANVIDRIDRAFHVTKRCRLVAPYREYTCID